MNSLFIFENCAVDEPGLLRLDLPDCVVLNAGDYIMLYDDDDDEEHSLITGKEYDVILNEMTYWIE
jgi:hypothetical protein